DVDPVEQVADVLIGQPDASRRDELADRGRIVGAVDAIFAGAEIHRPRAERIAGAAGHEARQIRLAPDHLSRRIPFRPLGLVAHRLNAGTGEAFAADADAVADRTPIAEHIIEICVAGIDDHGAGRLARVEAHNGATEAVRQRSILVLNRRTV